MTLKSPVSVHIEKHEASLRDVMNQIRVWLDAHKIEPAEFRSDTPRHGAIALDIRFRNEDEARLFEQEYGLILAKER